MESVVEHFYSLVAHMGVMIYTYIDKSNKIPD